MTPTPDDPGEDLHPLHQIARDAIQAVVDCEDVDAFDIAFDLCVGLLCVGSFSAAVKLLAEIDDQMTDADDPDDDEIGEVEGNA